MTKTTETGNGAAVNRIADDVPMFTKAQVDAMLAKATDKDALTAQADLDRVDAKRAETRKRKALKAAQAEKRDADKALKATRTERKRVDAETSSRALAQTLTGRGGVSEYAKGCAARRLREAWDGLLSDAQRAATGRASREGVHQSGKKKGQAFFYEARPASATDSAALVSFAQKLMGMLETFGQ